MIEADPPIAQPSGRRRIRPARLHGDKTYDIPRCLQHLHRRLMGARIGRKRIEPSQRLGRRQWVIERTLAWLNRYRRLTIRSERRVGIHQAFLTLSCALIRVDDLPAPE